MIRFLFTLTFILILFSCSSAANITDDMTPATLIQRGQEAMDRNNYKAAIQYYQVLRERNLTNIDLIITAEYHIAFIHYKQKKYDQARTEMNAVLAYYNSPDEVLYPQHFKRLAQIIIQNIEEKEKNRRPLFGN
ncbi:MAG: hypothetical protein FWD13_12130 [Treponema sp.]|nr:hypothetical protein [Treponema sp.]